MTTAPRTAREEQAARTRRYLITMAIRTVCFILAVALDGWLRWTFAAAAVVLPYIAVVAANAVRPVGGDTTGRFTNPEDRARLERGPA